MYVSRLRACCPLCIFARQNQSACLSGVIESCSSIFPFVLRSSLISPCFRLFLRSHDCRPASRVDDLRQQLRHHFRYTHRFEQNPLANQCFHSIEWFATPFSLLHECTAIIRVDWSLLAKFVGRRGIALNSARVLKFEVEFLRCQFYALSAEVASLPPYAYDALPRGSRNAVTVRGLTCSGAQRDQFTPSSKLTCLLPQSAGLNVPGEISTRRLFPRFGFTVRACACSGWHSLSCGAWCCLRVSIGVACVFRLEIRALHFNFTHLRTCWTHETHSFPMCLSSRSDCYLGHTVFATGAAALLRHPRYHR